jgi:hypothetical protein
MLQELSYCTTYARVGQTPVAADKAPYEWRHCRAGRAKFEVPTAVSLEFEDCCEKTLCYWMSSSRSFQGAFQLLSLGSSSFRK